MGSLENGEAQEASDTACATPAGCKLKSLAANKCNFGRVAMQTTYQSMNLVTHTLGVVTSLLCGCVNAGNVATCVLATVPEVCVFPYNVYSKIYSGSVQMWEAMKSATKRCMLHGDVTVSS